MTATPRAAGFRAVPTGNFFARTPRWTTQSIIRGCFIARRFDAEKINAFLFLDTRAVHVERQLRCTEQAFNDDMLTGRFHGGTHAPHCAWLRILMDAGQTSASGLRLISRQRVFDYAVRCLTEKRAV